MLTAASARADDRSSDVTEPPAYESFLVIPLRVHVLTSNQLPDADCKLTDADVRRIIGKVNGIWSKAGVHFGLDSIVREPAARVARFKLARSLYDDAAGQGGSRTPLGLFRLLIPDGSSRRFDGLHVYYLHALPVNGVYLGEDLAIVQETAWLRAVEGGLDEPLPRVTAHELGHALGLSHRQDRTNLLASGTTGTLLNAAEVAHARQVAAELPGTFTTTALREVAAHAPADRARRLWNWLAEIPGKEAAEARKRIDGK